MPQTPTMSTCGSNGIGSMFSSTISTSQYGGHSAASVARPSGGFMVRLFGKTSASAHLELQKLSGNRGLISSRRMGTVLLVSPSMEFYRIGSDHNPKVEIS